MPLGDLRSDPQRLPGIKRFAAFNLLGVGGHDSAVVYLSTA
jgi:hypothetical protein